MTENVDERRNTWFLSSEDLFLSPDGWLRFPHPRAQAQTRIVCFPPAGAEAFMYDRWVAFLPESFELCAVQLPEEEEYKDVGKVIAALADSILKYIRPGQKLVFCGVCLGAIWAYEVARYLRDHANIELDHLVVVTFPALDQRASATNFMHTSEFKNIMTSYFPPESPEYHYVLSRIPSMLYAADLADQDIPPVDTPLDCPMTAFASLHDQVIDPQLLWSWKPYTTGNFHVHMCDGDHFYGDHHQEEFLQKVVAYLEASVVQKI